MLRLIKRLMWRHSLKRSGLFDVKFYLISYPDVRKTDANPLRHYIKHGVHEGRNPNQLFDTNFYLTEYPDIAAGRINPLYHYIKHGTNEGRNPNPLFDSEFYLTEYPDIAAGWINPLYHYIKHGAHERRNPNPLFDTNYYLTEYPEIAAGGINPLYHYIKHGAHERRNPNPLFDTNFYLTEYPEIAASGINPLYHYIKHGVHEGRNPNPLFDTNFYLTEYPEIAAGGINPLYHYIKHGVHEGRNPNPLFDTNYYLTEYPEIAASGINPLYHYIKYGYNERRDQNKIPGFEAKRHLLKSHNREKTFNKSLFFSWDSNIQILHNILSCSDKYLEELPKSITTEAKNAVKRTSPNISVIMPVWNRAAIVCDAIDSVLNQSLTPYELIICDDGSIDNSVELIRTTYSEEIDKGLIKLLENEHSGVSASRNHGLSIAKGDLIAYLDSDNRWRKDYLVVMAAMFCQSDELNCAYSALRQYNNLEPKLVRATKYNRKMLLKSNFIDLNVFMHRSFLYKQYGGFDEGLTRLVDWDLIIRYTKNNPPAFIPFVGVDYYLDETNLKNVTFSESLDDKISYVYQKYFKERVSLGLVNLKIAYVLWDFPALSQTFVINELRWLINNGYDVKVYYKVEPEKKAKLDFAIKYYKVDDDIQLANLLTRHQRTICHSHFVYPAVTILTFPACQKAGIYFTFMPHAVDIFHHSNKERNKISEISHHKLCLKIFVYGDFHKKYLTEQGVAIEKIVYTMQAVNVDNFYTASKKQINKYSASTDKVGGKPFKAVTIARFIEKKGIEHLIDAAALLRDENVVFEIYGYGELKQEYEKKINQLDVNNISLMEPITSNEGLVQIYLNADAIVVPCVIAKNGDMDGFPTVILEAMAAGLPVITTKISAIPDYLTNGIEALITEPANPLSLSESILELMNMPSQECHALTERALLFLRKYIGVNKTMKRLLDIWRNYTVDIFMVTYDAGQHKNRKETFEIISRIFLYTTTPFTLTIVDNNSDNDFFDDLCQVVKGRDNVCIIRKLENKFCAPSSNIALQMGNNEFAIYLCSKEGFIKKHGWERMLIEHMTSNQDAAIGGSLSYLPKHVYGKEYCLLPYFKNFRNKRFAIENPDRIFAHIQGGIYIVRKEALFKCGLFNTDLSQNGMDIEMSYYLESCGYGLENINEVASITVKTLPKLSSVLDENVVVAHPLTIASVGAELDSLTKENGCRCNICGWRGNNFSIKETTNRKKEKFCPNCNSTSFGRKVFRFLATDHRIYRNSLSAILSADKSLVKQCDKLFDIKLKAFEKDSVLSLLEENKVLFDCIVFDPEIFNNEKIWNNLLAKITIGGEIVFADSLFLDEDSVMNAKYSRNQKIAGAATNNKNKYCMEHIDFISYCIGFDWRRLGRITRIS